MANALRFKKRYNPETGRMEETDEVLSLGGRAPSIRDGKVTGFRSAPGAPFSASDTMTGLAGNGFSNADGGARWATMFPNSGAGRRLGTAPDSSTMDSSIRPLIGINYNQGRLAGAMAAGGGLAPETAIDAPGMAADFERSAPSPTNPRSYADAALDEATQYFSQTGERPAFSSRNPAKSGDFLTRTDPITGKYGFAAVKSGQQYDYEERLKRLVADSSFGY